MGKDTLLRRLVLTLLGVLATADIAAITVWSFIQGHAELAQEAERAQPIKPPQRVSFERGEPVFTLDAAAQQQSGLRTVEL